MPSMPKRSTRCGEPYDSGSLLNGIFRGPTEDTAIASTRGRPRDPVLFVDVTQGPLAALS